MTKKKLLSGEPTGLTAFMSTTEVDGFPVREWSTQQFCELYPTLKIIIDKLMAAGMTLEKFSAEELMKALPTISDAVIPAMPDIIKISCPNNTAEDYDKLKWPRALQLVMGILKVNVEHLADFFAPSPE